MEKTVINGEFSVMIPDGYVAMTREELNKIYVRIAVKKEAQCASFFSGYQFSWACRIFSRT